MKWTRIFLLFSLLAWSMAGIAERKDAYRFALLPKVAHPWFELVHQGADQAAVMLGDWTGAAFTVEYLPPARADVAEQNRILEQAISRGVDGIMIDLLDADANRPLLRRAMERGIAVVVFDSIAPPGMELVTIGNDFCEQAQLASHRLAKLIGGRGEVAIMRGIPEAPNHALRARCHEETLKLYPDIRVVAQPFDYDDIGVARDEAIEVMRAFPNLVGWVSCDAAGPIGVGLATKDLGRVGKVRSVGSDDLPQMIELIREGVVDSSTSTKPRMQGYWSMISLWQATIGAPMPKRIDTGIGIVTGRMAQDHKGF